MYPIVPRRGNKHIAQGSALGKEICVSHALKGQKRYNGASPNLIRCSTGFCPFRAWLPHTFPQGAALGYLLVGLSGRLSDTCG